MKLKKKIDSDEENINEFHEVIEGESVQTDNCSTKDDKCRSKLCKLKESLAINPK